MAHGVEYEKAVTTFGRHYYVSHFSARIGVTLNAMCW